MAKAIEFSAQDRQFLEKVKLHAAQHGGTQNDSITTEELLNFVQCAELTKRIHKRNGTPEPTLFAMFVFWFCHTRLGIEKCNQPQTH